MISNKHLFNKNIGVLYFCMLLAGTVFILSTREMQAVLFVVFVLLAVVIGINKVDDPVLRRILLLALTLRFALSLIQTYTFIDLPGAGADALIYEWYGWQFAQEWHSGDINYTVHSAYYYYSVLIGLPYFFLGRTMLAPQLINIIFGVLIVYYIYLTAYSVSDLVRTSRLAAMMAAIFPTLAIFSAILLREIIIIFLIMYSCYMLITWLQRGSFYRMIVSFLAMAAASLFHGALIVLGWIHILMVTFYRPVAMKFKISIRQILFAMILILLFYLMTSELIIYKLPANLFELFSLEHFKDYVEHRTIGRTHYLEGFVPESYFDLLWHTPVRIVYFMFTPFPWMVTNYIDFLGFLDVCLYVFLLYYSCKGIKHILRTRKVETICLTLLTLSIVTMYSWGVVNYGTAWRHRAKVAPFLIVIASVGMASSKRWNRIIQNDSVYDELIINDVYIHGCRLKKRRSNVSKNLSKYKYR